MKNNPRRTLKPVKETKKIEPLVIDGTINYQIRITDEGYEIECPRAIENDLAVALLTRDIVEKRLVDIKITIDAVKGADKKFLKERQAKLVHTSYGLNVLSSDIIMTILKKASKI